MAESRGRAKPEVDPEIDPKAEAVPTAPPDVSFRRLRAARAARRFFFLSLCALLVAAILNLLGVRTGEATGSGGGYEVAVTYAEITRPGLATPWSVEIRRQGGFPRAVTVAVRSSYFDSFDENSLDPEPLGSVSDGERTTWTFEPPQDGDTLSISFDARIEPGVQFERIAGTVQVLEDGRAVATVRFKTLVLP